MLVDVRAAEYRLAYAANVTTNNSAIANPSDVIAVPANGSGVIDMAGNGNVTSNGLKLLPFATAGENLTFLLSVFAIDKCVDESSREWHTYNLLASFTCQTGNLAGIANTGVGTTGYYCDVITLGIGNANISNEIISPDGDVKASILLDTKGARKVYIALDRNGSAATCNCLWRRL